MFTLRDYQLQLVDAVDRSLLEGRRPCLVAPTGSGKTVMLAELVRRALHRGEKVIVAAHRNEIIKQLVRSLDEHLGLMPGLTSGPASTGIKLVQVCMMPTLARRPLAVQALSGRTVFLDEAHHIQSKSYQRILEDLQPGRFAGATATPITPTGGGLGKWGIDELVLGPQPAALMSSGALCSYKLYAAPAEIDVEGVSVRGGDYAVDELMERVIRINGSVVRDYRRFNPKQAPTITVTINIEHAHALCEIFRSEGISAQVVIGKTSQADRQDAFRRFERGELKVIVSVALIDEGLDLPAATCLQVLRPTKSLRLWKQLCGRVLRPSPGKDHAIILDHGGCWTRLPLPDDAIEWNLNKRTKPKPKPVEIDDDREVREQRELKVEEDNRELKLVNARTLVDTTLDKRIKRLNKHMFLVEHRKFSPMILREFVLNPAGICAAKRRKLEKLYNLQSGWIDSYETDPSVSNGRSV